ncbi:MAG: DUF4349 domain-containing protein [Deltaproteobacteria bacterium]|nr:DUF4349 domain-containing protein [Deltaproteobacteria bacterium]
MRVLLVLALLLLGVACKTTPGADANAAGASRSGRAAVAYGAGAEFDDAGAGMGGASDHAPRMARLAAAPTEKAAPLASQTSPIAGEAVADPSSAASIRREVIYSGYLRIVVAAVEEARRAVQELAEQAGGWLQESSARTIRIRVPADRFEATLEAIAGLGEVVDRSVTATDVTEAILDLDIRLENARKTRNRLLAHLAVSRKISDTLKIEAEVSRVSETIEQLEGKLRFMRSQIAMSSIHVDWSAAMASQPTTAPVLALPFLWIQDLGDGLVAGQVEPTTRAPRLLESKLRFEPPQDFIRYYASPDRVEALSADGLHLKVRRQSNHDRGALAFWKDLARESLVRSRAVAVGDERALGDDLAMIAGTREVGGQTLGYLLVLKRTNEHVYSFEAWGPKAVFDAHREALETSARSLER